MLSCDLWLLNKPRRSIGRTSSNDATVQRTNMIPKHKKENTPGKQKKKYEKNPLHSLEFHTHVLTRFSSQSWGIGGMLIIPSALLLRKRSAVEQQQIGSPVRL